MINKSDDIIRGILANHEIIMVRIMVIWLVVLTILKHMSSSMGRMTSHTLWKNKKCSKPPTSISTYIYENIPGLVN